MDEIKSNLKPRQVERLHEVADGLRNVYHTLVRMGYLETDWVDEGPHELQQWLPLYRGLEIDDSIIYLYSILPYVVDSLGMGRLDFFRRGEFSDFREKDHILSGRDPMHHGETKEGLMRPWMTALSQCGNHQTALIYDSRRHVLGIFGQMDSGSSDPNLDEEWVEDRDDSNAGTPGASGDIEHQRDDTDEDNGEEEEQGSNEEDLVSENDRESSDDALDDDSEDESDVENYWDEMDARSAPKVLRDINTWFKDTTELPGRGEAPNGNWEEELVKPLLIKYGWPTASFDRDGFKRAQAQATRNSNWNGGWRSLCNWWFSLPLRSSDRHKITRALKCSGIARSSIAPTTLRKSGLPAGESGTRDSLATSMRGTFAKQRRTQRRSARVERCQSSSSRRWTPLRTV